MGKRPSIEVTVDQLRVNNEAIAALAAREGIYQKDGALVRVFNERGEVRCPLRITRDVRPGVVVLPKGLWSHHTLNGQTSNALAPDDLTDVAGGACFNDSMVEVAAAGS